ncbi:MAG: hypothetical protein GY938_27180 [Ketobacter sp.]|nr:hypothetical protein [Ketobacter sp.]
MDILTDRVGLLDHRNGRKITTDRLDQRVTLHAMMAELFNTSEMRDLYYQCGMDYDDEVGNKSDRIWTLVDHFSKRENVLAKKCLGLEPGESWPFLK